MIERRERQVFYSPRARRHYLTKRAAAMAEATARVKVWCPTEKAEYDDSGRCTYGGSHFTQVPRLVAIRDRLARRYMRTMR